MTSDKRREGFDFDVEVEQEQDSSDEILRGVKVRNAKYFNAFSTPDGSFVLDDLKNVFYGPSSSNDPNCILLAEGARRLVSFIDRSVKEGGKDD